MLYSSAYSLKITAEAHVYRDERERARKRWFVDHAKVVQAILPRSSVLENYRTELAKNKDTSPLVPYHRFYEQPSLVKGTMKDYQVCDLHMSVVPELG